ncbi:MAG: CDP-glucose 4,6-dehydratase [Nitrospirae bacterium]|nr:CDP-glucose 4,6-dehydratase [Nitrospirota bacterium]
MKRRIGESPIHLFDNIYRGKRVLITGHTGFKGSWLCLWLRDLGASVIGFSLEPPTNPNHFDLLVSSQVLTFSSSQLPNFVSIVGDIRDAKHLNETFHTYRPEIVFHMAAQPLVRYSYSNPVETFQTNVMGTINVLEACRNTDSVRAVVNVTSDKCYENMEWVWGYRENDRMGGYDPYSASKGCAELVTNSYRRSFFGVAQPSLLLASARAGNVIGGGDWADDRLIPDIMRAVSRDEKVVIRNPKSTRPWQHVLEPLSGYLMLGQKLLEGRQEYAEGWNFGPDDESNINVETVVKKIKECWNKISHSLQPSNPPALQSSNFHEAGLLKLDCSKAHLTLNWKPVWGFERTISATAQWYKEFYENDKIMSQRDLYEYIQDAKNKKLSWTT